MMKLECKPIYLKYPVFQLSYIIFWIPIGYIISNIISVYAIKIVYFIMSRILRLIFAFAFEMFLFSGRMNIIMRHFYLIIVFTFDIIILLVGLELINYFLKKKIDGDCNE